MIHENGFDAVSGDALATAFDFHTHTTMSDGRADARSMIAEAHRKGVAIGISDHILMDNARLRSRDSLLEYVSRVHDHGVPAGVEISVGDTSDDALRSLADGTFHAFDYVIASLHQVDVKAGRVVAAEYLNWRYGLKSRYQPSVQSLDRHEYFDAWTSMLQKTLETMPVTILGHFAIYPELSSEVGPWPSAIDPRVDPEPDERAVAWLDETITLCTKYDVAIEINSKSRVPHEAFISRAFARGARFALGSDAHSLDRSGDIGFGLMRVRDLGITASHVLSHPRDGNTSPKSVDQSASR